MRKLSKDELVDGLYVQCREVGTGENHQHYTD